METGECMKNLRFQANGDYFTGVVGMMQRGEADFNMGGQELNAERQEVNDYAPILHRDHTVIFYKVSNISLEKCFHLVYRFIGSQFLPTDDVGALGYLLRRVVVDLRGPLVRSGRGRPGNPQTLGR